MADVKITVETGDTKQVFNLTEKTFSTGSKGFQAQGKVEAGGKRYQANLMLVEIGSKPGAKKGK